MPSFSNIDVTIATNQYAKMYIDHLSQRENKAALGGDLPCGNVSEEYQLPRVKPLEIHGEKGHARAVIAFVFKQKHSAGQSDVHQPSGYSSQSPAGSKCIVGYPSKVVLSYCFLRVLLYLRVFCFLFQHLTKFSLETFSIAKYSFPKFQDMSSLGT